MDPRLRILKMVSEKKITAEEAEKLLNVLETAEEKPRNLAIHIKAQGKRVDVNVPIILAKFGLKFVPEHILREKTGMTKKELIEMIERLKPQKIMDIEEDGKKIEIYIY